LLWNFWQPLTADDYSYVFSNSLSNQTIIQDLVNRYLTWSGRLSADFLVLAFLNQKTLSIGIIVINLLNALSLLLILRYLCILLYGRQYRLSNASLCCAVYLTFFIASGTFAQDFLWKTVAIQYSWGFALILFLLVNYLLPNQSAAQSPSCCWVKLSYLSSVLLCLVSGIIIGFYNEIYVAFIVVLAVSSILVSMWFKISLKQLVNLRSGLFLLAVVISGILSILAPGNFIRRATYLEHNLVDIGSHNWLIKLLMTYKQFFRYGYHVLFAVLIVYIVFWLVRNRHKIVKQDFIMLTFLIVLLNLQIISFIEVAYYSPIAGRMLIFIDTTLFLIVYKFIQLRYRLSGYSQEPIKDKSYLVHFMLIIVCVVLTCGYYQLHQYVKSRQQLIVSAQNKLLDVQLPLLNYNASLNLLVRHIVYFDAMRTSDADFIRLYKLNKLN
jgi:hypothetical protein